ncbi:hypothetical protein D9V96_004325 [Zobellia laminariae]|uniref:EF-hand domain-containing protein n=1 Tax=Zobellia barbeyronii TaxID=2748009 RepID=A0ABS5WGF3_9FLAO|nr:MULTISPECIES: hypothetical protein [Zobellia]MBT2162432.1 hypothetical protein [Zobellia barbeyronii]MUH38894.1 hypothetical protein [Zobellia laminariae]WKX74594.1 hypothetical protein Q5W13_12225 [Zobellia laminariae]
MNYPSLIGFIIGVLAIIVLAFIERRINNPYLKSLWRSALFFFSMYVLILVLVFFRWKYYEMQLSTFDLNADGSIGLKEYTDQYRFVRDKVMSGADRNFAFVTGAALSFLLAGLALILDLINTWIKSKNNPIQS